MTCFRIPTSLTMLCGITLAATGAWATDAPPPDATGVLGPAAVGVAPLDLPDIDALTAASDFSVFMNPGVPVELRRRALRQLWSLDPQLVAVDDLGDYARDYTTAKTRAFAEARRLAAPTDWPVAAGISVVPPTGLPAIGSLTAESDFAAFMRDGVPGEQRHRALRKLWSVAPQFAFVDKLGDYNADYTGTRAAYVAGNPVQVTVELGTRKDEFIITPAQLRFGRNQRYELVVTNPSDTTHHFSAAQFGASVMTQKAVLYNDAHFFLRIWLDEERPSPAAPFAAQLTKGVEIRPGGEARWIFIPIQAGQFDFGCAIEGHRKKGMTGSITVAL